VFLFERRKGDSAAKYSKQETISSRSAAGTVCGIDCPEKAPLQSAGPEGGVESTMGGSTIQRPLAVMMSRRILSVSPAVPVVEAARVMGEAKVGALLVAEGTQYVGIITESDLVRKVLAAGRDAARMLVSEVMIAPIITIEIDRSAHDASDLMAERAIRHLAVTEDGRIVGMLSVRDLLRYFKNWGAL